MITEIGAGKSKQQQIAELISRAAEVTMEDYSSFLDKVAHLRMDGVLDDIARNKIIDTLGKNKVVGAGKKLIAKALLKLERDLRPQQPNTHIHGGLGSYRVEPDGIYKLTESGDIRICSTLQVLAETRTTDNDGWGRLLEWRDSDYCLHRWAMPTTLTAGDGNEAIKMLLNRGLHITPGHTKNVIDYIMSVSVEQRLTSTDKTGWHDEAFITADAVYGSDEYVFQSESGINAPISQKGSLRDWQQRVAAKATGNSRIVFAISSAFAGSLLEGTGVDSGGFHIYGTSTDGKSTAQFIAASVWGAPNAYTRTWRATANGLEGMAAIHNDGLMILDEIGQASHKDIGEVVYMLANGQSKARMKANMSNRKAVNWRLLALSSGEYTLGDIMRSEAKRTFAGQELRLANIPSNAGAGMGIFEDIHKAPSPGQFADDLKKAIKEQYGTAGHAWLTFLTGQQKWRQSAETALESFVKEVSTGLNPQAGRVARRFALVAFAGELATQEGITGWKQGEATQAAKTCFYAWLNEYGKGNREHKNVLDAVRAFIDSNPARFQKVFPESQIVNTGELGHSIPEEARAEARPILNRVGFKFYTGKEEPDYYLLASTLEELAQGYTSSEIRAALFDAGWIKTETAKNKHIPKEGKPRCYELDISKIN